MELLVFISDVNCALMSTRKMTREKTIEKKVNTAMNDCEKKRLKTIQENMKIIKIYESNVFPPPSPT